MMSFPFYSKKYAKIYRMYIYIYIYIYHLNINKVPIIHYENIFQIYLKIYLEYSILHNILKITFLFHALSKICKE